MSPQRDGPDIKRQLLIRLDGFVKCSMEANFGRWKPAEQVYDQGSHINNVYINIHMLCVPPVRSRQ